MELVGHLVHRVAARARRRVVAERLPGLALQQEVDARLGVVDHDQVLVAVGVDVGRLQAEQPLVEARVDQVAEAVVLGARDAARRDEREGDEEGEEDASHAIPRSRRERRAP